MGLPKIQIKFTDSARTLLPRSERGIVLVLASKKSGATGNLRYEFDSSIFENKELHDEIAAKTNKGLAYATSALRAGAKKVILHLIDETNTLTKVLIFEKPTKFNYLVYPECPNNKKTEIVTYIKNERKAIKGKKAVLFNANTPNESGIINFTTPKVTVDILKNDTFKTLGSEVSDEVREIAGADYTARIAGTLAGISLAISSTYYVLDELIDCSQSDEPDKDIDDGKLILINDGEKIKIARGVNSRTEGTETFKKIKMVDGMDLILEDIKKIFNDEFIGKMTASYENKMGFIDAINGIYFRRLLSTVLDPEFENKVDIDVEAVKNYMIERGYDIDNYEEAEIRAFPTGSTLFLKGRIRLLDALEDLELNFVI